MEAESSSAMRRTGRLEVRVYAGNEASPVAGAGVRIAEPGGGPSLMQLLTDVAGRVPAVELTAPPERLSLQPQANEKPYAEYDVFVTAPGFHPMRAEGVQLFADNTAIQRIPLQRQEFLNLKSLDIYIPPHTLWGVYPRKIPEAENKQLLAKERQLAIPEAVKVHLGAPDEIAETVSVPFKEYIKNVASCAVYPTWPEESLRANILAILSFTLSRIFTDWYRRQGYAFTITSSTAYDQAFAYDRNTYQNISVLVEELFTTYITRPGIGQPLLAQYCDGSRVSCPHWLEQWGSAVLPGEGMDALSILRYYYGQNIFLQQAQRVENAEPFPGMVLKAGAYSSAVNKIEEQLNAISEKYIAIDRLAVDGKFGPQTTDAVRTFQTLFGLPVTGEVDFATWYKIQEIFADVKERKKRLSEFEKIVSAYAP